MSNWANKLIYPRWWRGFGRKTDPRGGEEGSDLPWSWHLHWVSQPGSSLLYHPFSSFIHAVLGRCFYFGLRFVHCFQVFAYCFNTVIFNQGLHGIHFWGDVSFIYLAFPLIMFVIQLFILCIWVVVVLFASFFHFILWTKFISKALICSSISLLLDS